MAQKRRPKGNNDGEQFAPKVGPESTVDLTPEGLTTTDEAFQRLLKSAATLQEMVPDAVLVGGSAAAFYVGHRQSTDHDHVIDDLSDRFGMVLEALESQGGWITNRVVPNKIILGQLGDIEAGVRQLRRRVPLEVIDYKLDNGQTLRVPTPDETLRVKGYLAIVRNRTRDYLDIAALSQWMGTSRAAATLRNIGDYYEDQRFDDDGAASQLAVQLADPRPSDSSITKNLGAYKRLTRQWHDWDEVRAVCAQIAVEMCTEPEDAS
ncbi:MAG TPA: hypothetical protein VMU68_11340 [Acidimicrobiales bacterium]|jgi:hypothetical protein|nr:hypothetical protein [Acidimicrobiales bacterium]